VPVRKAAGLARLRRRRDSPLCKNNCYNELRPFSEESLAMDSGAMRSLRVPQGREDGWRPAAIAAFRWAALSFDAKRVLGDRIRWPLRIVGAVCEAMG
jgi:hypothetical protein